tara:strand:- start:2609 stop:7510 length:4902 start_codon:yes stop_codon:yes gene_type:complete
MTISTSNSTVAVTYFDASGVAIPSGTSEADGAEYALLTATVLDGSSAAVSGAQVVFELDAASPDRTALVTHAQAKPNGTGAVSITDGSGVATARLYSQDANNSPLTVNVRAGEDNGTIANFTAPTSSSAGAAGSHGTTLGATTVTGDGDTFTDTQFTGLVRVEAQNVTFTNCTFTGGGTLANAVSIQQDERDVQFLSCTFTATTGHAVLGTGFYARDCHWHTIGLSAVNLSTTVQQEFTTTLERCLIEKVGSVSGSAALTAAPGYKLFVDRCKIDCPHESSTNAVSGFNGRGAISITTRRPNAASTFVFERCWLYGGGDYVVDSKTLDTGNAPSGVRILECRIGAPADYSDPAGSLGYITSSTDIGFIAQGNLNDADGQLIDTLNTHAGVGWYWSSDFLDVAATVTFEEEPWPQATVVPPNTTPTIEAPRATAEGAFNTTTYRNPPKSTVDPGVANPLGRTLDSEGTPIFLDPYRDEVPTARGLYRPKARQEGSSQPAAFEVQFDADDQVLSVSERSVTVNLTIRASQVLTTEVDVGVIYSGVAQNGVDYIGPTTVTIAAGASSVELPIQILTDADTTEDDEQIFIVIDALSDGLIGQRSVANITIIDFPEIPASVTSTASFRTAGLLITEGETATFVVELHMSNIADCTVTYTIPTNELSAGEFTDVTGGSVVIPAGSLTADIVISTVDDTNIEGQETMLLQITGVTSSFNIGDQDTAILRVADNDFVQNAEVQFTQPVSQVLESSTREIRIMASVAVAGDVDITFTETAGAGLTSGDYNLVDEFGGAITSPIRIPDGEQVALIYFESTDDTTVEGDEVLTLTLTGVTGNATLGAQLTHAATILDDDTSGSGSDGDLYGLVPERTTVDLTGAEYDVYPDRYVRAANVGLGITAKTVNTNGYYLAQAIKDAQVYWTALNEAASAGSATTLQDRTASLYAEGVTVRIRINGDCDQNGYGFVNWSTNPSDTNAASWASPDLAIVRDIVVFGATSWTADIIGHQVFYDDYREDIGADPATGRRICANIRFERLSIEGDQGFARNVGVIALTGVLNDYQTNGFFKFYNCRFTNDRAATISRPQKWNVRSFSMTAGWDFRGCYSYLALEHFIYINSPRGGFYVVNCTHIRGGYSTTFCQSVNRAYDAGRIPGQSQYGNGNIVYMRNVIWDTSSGDELRGGADLTIQGQDADCYFVENEHLGLAVHGSGSGRRGAITMYAASWYSFFNTGPVVSHKFEYDGFQYASKAAHLYGGVVAWENGNGRQSIGFSGVKEIDIRAFEMTGLHFREQIQTDKIGVSLGDSMEMINGVPSRGAGHGVTWDLRWPNWNSEPYTGPIADYPGWHQNVPKMTNYRSRRLANFNTENRTLSDAELNVPFDGTPTWAEGGRKPAAQWEATRLGLPVGADLTVYAGHERDSRSVLEQTWTYTRTLENYNTGLFIEVTNSVVEVGDGGAAGNMLFTYLDRDQNFEIEERPEFSITSTQTPVVASSPGLIRYQLEDIGVNATLVGSGALDVFIYGPDGFGTIQWDRQRYGSAGTMNISIGLGENQNVYLETSTPTWMSEVVNVTKNVASTTAATGINNFNWTFAPGATERYVRLVSTLAASPGETLILDINTVLVEGITAGVIGSTSQLTITYTA